MDYGMRFLVEPWQLLCLLGFSQRSGHSFNIYFITTVIPRQGQNNFQRCAQLLHGVVSCLLAFCAVFDRILLSLFGHKLACFERKEKLPEEIKEESINEFNINVMDDLFVFL
jgi:hypothetical protein